MNNITDEQIESIDWSYDYYETDRTHSNDAPVDIVRAKLVKEMGWNDQIRDDVIREYKKATNGDSILSDDTINILKQTLLPPHFTMLLSLAARHIYPGNRDFNDIYNDDDLALEICCPQFTDRYYGRKAINYSNQYYAALGIACKTPKIYKINKSAINLYTMECAKRIIPDAQHLIYYLKKYADRGVGGRVIGLPAEWVYKQYPKPDDEMPPKEESMAEISKYEWFYRLARGYLIYCHDEALKAEGVNKFCLSSHALFSFKKMLHPWQFSLALRLAYEDRTPTEFISEITNPDVIAAHTPMTVRTSDFEYGIRNLGSEFAKFDINEFSKLPPISPAVYEIYKHEYNIWKQGYNIRDERAGLFKDIEEKPKEDRECKSHGISLNLAAAHAAAIRDKELNRDRFAPFSSWFSYECHCALGDVKEAAERIMYGRSSR